MSVRCGISAERLPEGRIGLLLRGPTSVSDLFCWIAPTGSREGLSKLPNDRLVSSVFNLDKNILDSFASSLSRAALTASLPILSSSSSERSEMYLIPTFIPQIGNFYKLRLICNAPQGLFAPQHH